MSTVIDAGSGRSSDAGFLERERTVAGPGFNRWLVPPAALAIHLCIGMAYGFSVFWLPLTESMSGAESASCAELNLFSALFTTECNWRVSDLGWIYTLFFVLLGSSAALWGGWLERAGPRKAGVVAAFCWCGGMAIAAVGVMLHQLWLMWLGAGVIGGIGLGLGYISPVSTLIKWFPDRRGLATGLAIMGFGGGAMVGAPLADSLMGFFSTPDSVGVWETLLTMAGIYFIFMMAGAFGYRVPPADWRPEGWAPPQANCRNQMITRGHVHLRDAHRTPQFWLVWAVLFLNVSAGIGVIGMASPMLQELFGGRLIDQPDLAFSELAREQRAEVASIAAAFTGLLSVFNIVGRLFWASLSDWLGRKNTYYVFLVLGIALYASAPSAVHFIENPLVFIAICCIIVSMYGGGFSTVPAYLADLFGTQFVGAIHGRLLTAWATAGVVGPVLVNYIREAQISAGISNQFAYDFTLYVLALLLAAGVFANYLVRPVSDKWFISDDELSRIRSGATSSNHGAGSFGIGRGYFDGKTLLAWSVVIIPILWGAWVALYKTVALF